MHSRARPAGGFLLFTALSTVLAAYFAYAAIRGDLGVIERLVVNAQIRELQSERAALEADIAELSNKTKRMSDAYLDLDLLDEQARSILGMMRADELVIR